MSNNKQTATETNEVILRNWLQKHATIAVFIGFGFVLAVTYVVKEIFTLSESISAIFGWASFFGFMIWIGGGVDGLKKTFGISVKVVKWLLIVSIVIGLICLVSGWIAAVPPMTMIIILLFLILLKK